MKNLYEIINKFYVDISFDNNKKKKLNKNHDKISQQVNVSKFVV